MSKEKDMAKVTDFVGSIINKKTTESERLFKEIISPKILGALADKRMEIAQRIFREATEDTFEVVNSLMIDSKTKKPKIVCTGTKESCNAYINGVKDKETKSALKLQAAKTTA